MSRTLGQIQIQNIVRSYQKAPRQEEELRQGTEGQEMIRQIMEHYTPSQGTTEGGE